jgi:glycosyltransferase involved in cell wall biosynthesis
LAACAGALPEIVRPGQNGYLFAPHDAHALADMMRELANHPEERQVFSRESLKMARRHDFRNTLLAYQEVYRQLNPQIELRVDVEKIEADCLGCW